MDQVGNLRGRTLTKQLAVAAAAMALLVPAGRALCDDPVFMAPPVDVSAPVADASSVFNWTEVPQQQQVPITRAVFDRNGYQLFDTAGETIVVPFTNNNLYVMKFAVSHTGSMYFINRGDYPVLFVPQDGYLENATVSGARWFPFSPQYHPDDPVFLGCAPSWDAFVGFGWYPGLCIYGGYYCDGPFFTGAVLFPEIGFFIDFGGHHWDRWDGYRNWEIGHPAPYHLGYYDRDVYRWAAEDHGDRAFHGAGFAGRGFGGDTGWARNNGSSHVFRGVAGGYGADASRNYVGRDTGGPAGGARAFNRGQDFHGGRDLGERPLETGRDSGITPGADRFFRGASQSAGAERSNDAGAERSGGRSHEFSGGGGGRSFQGGGGRGDSGGGRGDSGGGHDHGR